MISEFGAMPLLLTMPSRTELLSLVIDSAKATLMEVILHGGPLAGLLGT